MRKKFVWQDLWLHFNKIGAGRQKHALQRLLNGETVDLAAYPRAPQKAKKYRSVKYFCNNLKQLLKDHEGVAIDGDVVRIPELQKPKSFLKDV